MFLVPLTHLVLTVVSDLANASDPTYFTVEQTQDILLDLNAFQRFQLWLVACKDVL